MAVTVQTIQSSNRNLVVKLYIAGANAAALVIDSAITDTNLSLVEAWWSLTGGSAQLLWDANADDVLVDLCAGFGVFYIPEGGLPNPRSAGVTNDVLLTNGAGLTNGTVILKFKKS